MRREEEIRTDEEEQRL